MKRLVYILMACLLLMACELEFSDNGDLDGYWQLRQQDTLATGGIADMRESGLYWAVGFNLLEIRNTKNYALCVFFRFQLKDGTLTISEPYFDDRSVGDIRIDDPVELERYGIGSLVETFQVERLSNSEMCLRNGRYRYHFRKY